jgi:hypothetical protein
MTGFTLVPFVDDSTFLFPQQTMDALSTVSGTSFVPKWKSGVTYALDAMVVNPSGDIVTAIIPHTSGATYTAGNWKPSGSFASATVPATVTGSRVNGYDRRLNIYNLKPKHLRRTHAALGRAYNGYGSCSIAIVGDSTDAGIGTNSASNDSWPGRLKKNLVNVGAFNGGTGFVVGAPNAPGVDNRWTLGAGWAAWGDGSSALANDTTLNPATFVSDSNGTIVKVLYGAGLGAFTVQIDGGSIVTIPSAAGTTGTPTIYQVSGLTNAPHTVVINSTAVGTYPMILGVSVEQSSGLVIHNLGIGGGHSALLTNPSPWFPGNLASSAALAADLVVQGFMINDSNDAVPVATYKSNVLSGVAILQSRGADLILRTPMPVSGTDLTPYIQALYEIADQADLPLIDLNDRAGTWTLSNGNGIMSDNFHPNAFGYADMARCVMLALAL